MSASLPKTIALFPLSGAILLPNSILPLHIFELRYQQMVQDCMEGSPYIGMIQPQEKNPERLYKVGCVGKVEYHRELPNGNYLIRLQGENRFEIQEEISSEKLYRQARVDYSRFAHDLEKQEIELEKKPLYEAFQNYLEPRNMDIAWEKIETIPMPDLVNILSMNLEFNYSEKQTLLESYNISTRWQDLINLLKMSAFPGGENENSGMLIN